MRGREVRNRDAKEHVPAFALGLAWGGTGALSCALGEPLVALAWIAVVAAPAGFHCGARGVRPWPFGMLAPAVWMIGVTWLDATGAGELPTPIWGALAWTGLFCAAMALGALRPGAAWRGASALLLAGGLLAGLPIAGGPGGCLGERSVGEVSPGVAARLFDLAPPVLLVEVVGVDFMRHPGVYERAGTEWFSDRRAPFRGILAGPLLLLVGCTALFAASRRRAAPPE